MSVPRRRSGSLGAGEPWLGGLILAGYKEVCWALSRLRRPQAVNHQPIACIRYDTMPHATSRCSIKASGCHLKNATSLDIDVRLVHLRYAAPSYPGIGKVSSHLAIPLATSPTRVHHGGPGDRPGEPSSPGQSAQTEERPSTVELCRWVSPLAPQADPPECRRLKLKCDRQGRLLTYPYSRGHQKPVATVLMSQCHAPIVRGEPARSFVPMGSSRSARRKP